MAISKYLFAWPHRSTITTTIFHNELAVITQIISLLDCCMLIHAINTHNCMGLYHLNANFTGEKKAAPLKADRFEKLMNTRRSHSYFRYKCEMKPKCFILFE